MGDFKFVLGFLPWIVFTVVSQRLAANGVAWSATIAVAMTVVALVPAWKRNGPKILNLGSLVLFAVIAIVGFVGGPDVDLWLYDWGPSLVAIVLGLYVLATVPVLPFTAEYARQSVARQYWESPTFKRINRVLSAAWGVAILIIGCASAIATAVAARPTDFSDAALLELVLNWVVPIAVIAGMIRFSSTYPDRVRGGSTPDEAQEPARPAGGTAG